MGSKGGFILLGPLFILAVLCHVGHSLESYSCINAANGRTTVFSYSHNQDTCFIVKAMPPKTYYQCWMFDRCSFEAIAKALGEKELQYRRCQENLGNKSDGTSISGKTALLGILLLLAVWRFCL
ncbi:CD59 glycoprotein-like [Mesoplodon densirostris]|uniref:CD59 glycoprotein-like n=1 Tax=Mesoplodon densirostris TaxID=48708 RepID=UPI0028DB8D06|nr:CD59 glycoprotein-like [Mesoplodon densirostris]